MTKSRQPFHPYGKSTKFRLQTDTSSNLSEANQCVFEHLASTSQVPLNTKLIHSDFIRYAKTQPQAIAVKAGDKSITYSELDKFSDRIAKYLLVNDIGSGNCVPLFLERSIEMVVGILGILKAGAAYVPQHVTVAPLSQLQYVVDKTQSSIVFSLKKFASEIEKLNAEALFIEDFMSPISKMDGDVLLANSMSRPDDRCVVLFTSGTTGNPNGVEVTHRNLCNILKTKPGNLGIKPGTTVSQLLSISFDMAAWEIHGCLSNGGTLIIRGKDFTKAASQADVIIATPSVLAGIDESRCSPRTVAVAGEPCPRQLADTWSLKCNFYNCCGPTETTIVNTMHLHDVNDSVICIGKPTPNNTVYVLDNNQTPCEIGEKGVMWAGGLCVTKGYLGNEELTNERYRPDPFLGKGYVMFNTRDLGRWLPHGGLEHLGRTDDQVKVRGFRVELDSVSAALESITECTRATVCKYDSRTLIGFVEPADIDTENAKKVVSDSLPYYCVPERVIALEKLPLTPRGKIDKSKLMEIAKSGQDESPQSNPALSADTQAKTSAKIVEAKQLNTESYPDTILPPESNTFSAKLKHHRFYHYWRLLAMMLAINSGVGVYAILNGWWGLSGINISAISNVVVANITLAILIRQQYVVNLLFKVATSVPVTWPLRFRQLMGKVYHFGGLHIGGAVAGTFWMIVLLVSIIVQRFFDLPGHTVSNATLVVAVQLATLLTAIIMMARPSFRSKFHNHFEIMHRFGGWLSLGLFWLLAVFLTNDSNTTSSFWASPAAWCLAAVTISIALPWMRLKKVPVTIVKPSNHAILADFNYGVTPFAGSSTTISRNPLTEWHSFANVPHPNRDGFRLTISRAGDWTGKLIDDVPSHVWVKGIPTAGVGNVDQLFRKVVWIATGSGIGPTLPHLLSREVPAHLVWSTRNARSTYGDELVDEILEVEPNALIWDTDSLGRPDLIKLAYAAVQEFQAEAVIVIANEKLTRMVVHGMESRGIPAYGAIWDS